MFPDLTSRAFWWAFGISTAKVIAVAVLFELLALLANQRLRRALATALTADAGRDPAWRMKRRERLRRTTRGLVRGVLYSAGLLVILDVFQARVVPVYFALGLVTLIGVAGCSGVLRDLAAGYALLLEDALAPGDTVELEGVRGVVEAVDWRTVRVRAQTGETHLFRNHLLRHLVVAVPSEPASTAQTKGFSR